MDFAYFCCKRWSDPGFVMGDHSRRRSSQELKSSCIWLNKKYPEQKIPCPCTYCLKQVVKTWQQEKDDLLLYRMSPTYTTWIHHGEEGGGTDIIEPSIVHASHHDGWIAEEEE